MESQPLYDEFVVDAEELAFQPSMIAHWLDEEIVGFEPNYKVNLRNHHLGIGHRTQFVQVVVGDVFFWSNCITNFSKC